MKIHCLLLCLLSTLIFIVACQKEKSFESGTAPSAGLLQTDASGDCLPKTVGGVFEEGKVLVADSNFIDVQVNVTKAGSYTIYTDTVNGFYFRATGTFSSTGTKTVKLNGNGTPVNDGISNFTVTYTTSQCVVPVNVLPAGSGSIAADFTLAGAPDICMNFVLAGTYTVNTAMTPANTVTINVNVTTIGTYSISTPVSNGISFSGSGNLPNLGAQTIVLTAAGTPVAAGATNFQVAAGPSVCSFTVDVTGGTTVSTYFPLTAGSNWSYEFDQDADDSVFLRAKSGTVTLGGNQYNVLEYTFDAGGGFDDFGNYSISGGDYHTYADMGDYFGLDNPAFIDYIFLKDNVPAGSTWQSGPINGTITDTSGVFPVSLRVAFTIDQKDVSVNVNGTPYNNVIVVTEKYEIFDGVSWVDLTELLGYYKTYYARDIGMIKQDSYDPDGTPTPPISFQMDIRRYQVVP
ncbi:MAG TPA: hypothetical protein VFD56_08775 [Chitinophagaceae bacterium]|nr:hypothetical protein [Chitinophagaceae bacterium]